MLLPLTLFCVEDVGAKKLYGGLTDLHMTGRGEARSVVTLDRMLAVEILNL